MARRTKKCTECKKECERDKMIHIDDITRNGNVKTKSYCSKECSEAEEKRKRLLEDTNNLLESILEMPVRTNIYFNSLYSPIIKHYGYEAIYNLLHSEYGYICDALNKDFITANVKIKYFMAIVQNKIEDYKNTEVKKEDEVVESNIEIIEVPKVEFKSKVKKSIFDI